MPKIFVVNAGGFAEPGGGVVQNKSYKEGAQEACFKDPNNNKPPGLTENIICSLFGTDPRKASSLNKDPEAKEWLKGFIGANFEKAKEVFKKEDNSQLRGDSIENGEKVTAVGDFFFAHDVPKKDVAILTVAAPNFNDNDPSTQSTAFKAGKVRYSTEYNNNIKASIKKSYNNIFQYFINYANEGDKLYLYDIGTDIFSPGAEFDFTYDQKEYKGAAGYKKFVRKIEEEVFLEYQEKIKGAGLIICSKCLSRLNDKLKDGVLIEPHKNIDKYSLDKKSRELQEAAKKAAQILNENKYTIGKSEIFQSSKLEKSDRAELDVGQFKLTTHSTTQAIFANSTPDTKVIIHNFANDNNIGGGPGIESDGKGKFIETGTPAKAQEENLCHSSNLLASLSQFAKEQEGQLVYEDKFNGQSTSKSIISKNVTFFAKNHLKNGFIDWDRGEVDYKVDPVEVDVVTVAAKRYGKGEQNNIADTVKRIREQLAASAHLAHKNSDEVIKPHIVMGAFGCGAFNNDPALIARIYRKFLENGGEFNKAFPEGTTFEFAIPLNEQENDIVKLKGQNTTAHPNVPNYQAFDQYFQQNKEHDKDDAINRAIDTTKDKKKKEKLDGSLNLPDNAINIVNATDSNPGYLRILKCENGQELPLITSIKNSGVECRQDKNEYRFDFNDIVKECRKNSILYEALLSIDKNSVSHKIQSGVKTDIIEEKLNQQNFNNLLSYLLHNRDDILKKYLPEEEYGMLNLERPGNIDDYKKVNGYEGLELYSSLNNRGGHNLNIKLTGEFEGLRIALDKFTGEFAIKIAIQDEDGHITTSAEFDSSFDLPKTNIFYQQIKKVGGDDIDIDNRDDSIYTATGGIYLTKKGIEVLKKKYSQSSTENKNAIERSFQPFHVHEELEILEIQDPAQDICDNIEELTKYDKKSYQILQRSKQESSQNDKCKKRYEQNLKKYSNPKVFAGWGGSLSHEKDSIFNIDNVIDGGFAAKIGLTTKGNKIKIDLNHEDFRKDGKQFEGKMLEAALINKLRAGELGGIKKIGHINVETDRERIEKLYKRNIKIFSKDDSQTNYSIVKGQPEISLTKENYDFLKSLEGKEKTEDQASKSNMANSGNSAELGGKQQIEQLIEEYINDRSPQSRANLERHINNTLMINFVSPDGKIQSDEELAYIVAAEQMIESSPSNFLESRVVLRIISHFSNNLKFGEIDQDTEYNTNISLNWEEDSAFEAIKGYGGTVSSVINDDDTKRVFVLSDGTFFSVICQEKKEGVWSTVFYDVRGKKKDKIVESLPKNANITGFICHDGTCGIGAACMAVNFLNEGQAIDMCNNNHRDAWRDILKTSPSPSPSKFGSESFVGIDDSRRDRFASV